MGEVAFKSQYLDAAEAALYLNRSLSWLYKRVWRKEIPFFKPDGKLVFIKEDLDLWMRKRVSPKAPCISKFQEAKESLSSLTTDVTLDRHDLHHARKKRWR